MIQNDRPTHETPRRIPPQGGSGTAMPKNNRLSKRAVAATERKARRSYKLLCKTFGEEKADQIVNDLMQASVIIAGEMFYKKILEGWVNRVQENEEKSL